MRLGAGGHQWVERPQVHQNSFHRGWGTHSLRVCPPSPPFLKNHETYYRSARAHFSNKFWTILNDFEEFLIISNNFLSLYLSILSLSYYLTLSRSILVYLSLSRSIMVYLCLSQSIDRLGHRPKCKA